MDMFAEILDVEGVLRARRIDPQFQGKKSLLAKDANFEIAEVDPFGVGQKRFIGKV